MFEQAFKNTGAAQPRLTQTALNSIPIPIPRSVRDRERIVKEITGVAIETDRLATNYERKPAALEELRKSMLHQAFSGNL